jgi:hypothetical protein
MDGPSKDQAPAPESLNAKRDELAKDPSAAEAAPKREASPKRVRRGSYRPSHRATFIGLAVVIIILGVNAGVITFLIKGQNKKIQSAQGQVTISQAALDKIGVNQNPVGDSGIVLTVNPNAKFNGNLQVAGNVSVGGFLNLNKALTVSNANITQLQAGNTSLQQLNVNGDGTVSNLNVRSQLTVTGTSHFQGPTTLSQLLTVQGGINVSGNLAVGGTLAVGSFHTSSLVSDFGLTFGGHVITQGSAPGVSAGNAACLGQSGTVSISGNDAAGTVDVNVGAGSNCGGDAVVAYVSFRTGYTNIPKVVVTAVGPGADNVYVDPSTGGFDIGVSSITNAGHEFDYIVEQ